MYGDLTLSVDLLFVNQPCHLSSSTLANCWRSKWPAPLFQCWLQHCLRVSSYFDDLWCHNVGFQHWSCHFLPTSRASPLQHIQIQKVSKQLPASPGFGSSPSVWPEEALETKVDTWERPWVDCHIYRYNMTSLSCKGSIVSQLVGVYQLLVWLTRDYQMWVVSKGPTNHPKLQLNCSGKAIETHFWRQYWKNTWNMLKQYSNFLSGCCKNTEQLLKKSYFWKCIKIIKPNHLKQTKGVWNFLFSTALQSLRRRRVLTFSAPAAPGQTLVQHTTSKSNII